MCVGRMGGLVGSFVLAGIGVTAASAPASPTPGRHGSDAWSATPAGP